jgi:hypothetical protein
MGLGTSRSYEDLLADGLEEVLKSGAESLEEITKALNERNVHGPNGERWTEALLESEFKRLAP